MLTMVQKCASRYNIIVGKEKTIGFDIYVSSKQSQGHYNKSGSATALVLSK
jgi:hypothetical protein